VKVNIIVEITVEENVQKSKSLWLVDTRWWTSAKSLQCNSDY